MAHDGHADDLLGGEQRRRGRGDGEAGRQAIRVAVGVWRERDRWESLAFWSVALLIATAVVELLAAITA